MWQKRFQEKDVICFGGGNEKYLAEVFEKVGMKRFLMQLPENKVYVGISAGSMVIGTFMPDKLYPMIFPEENFGSTESKPAEILPFCFIPHLNSSFFTHIRKEVLDVHSSVFTTAIYSTDDDTALIVDGASKTIVGNGDSWIHE